MTRKRSPRSPQASTQVPPSQKRQGQRSSRRRIHPFPPALLVLLAAVVIAARAPLLGTAAVDLMVYSTGLRLVLDDTIDLVPLYSKGGGIPLETPWIGLRAVDVTPLDAPGRTVRVAERAISTRMLNRLRISQGCDVQIEPMGGGFVRLAIKPANSNDSPCTVAGAVKADPNLTSADSLDRPPLLEGMPPFAALEFTAEPALSRPAIVEFHPSEALQVSGIQVSLLSFETSERSPYPVGSIMSGTIGFPGLRDGEVKLPTSDKLSLKRVRGTMELMVGDSLRTEFAGKASASSISSGNAALKPTVLDQVQSSALLLAIGAVVPVLAGTFEWLEQRKRNRDR